MRRTRPAITLIFAITATGITANPLIAPVIPDILAGLQVPRSQAGWVVGAATLPGIVLAPIVGALADRFGRRLILVPCLALFGVAGGLCATAGSFEMLVFFRFLQGAGSAGLVNLAVVLIADHWSATERAGMVGRNAAVLTICLTIFPVLGGVLSDLGGWRWAFAPFPLALLTAGSVWRRLPPDKPTETVPLSHQFSTALPTLRSAHLLGVLAGGCIVFMVLFGVMLTVLPVYLEAAFGLSATLRGLVLGVPAIANTAAALSTGRLRSIWSYRTILLAGTGLLTVGLLGMTAASTVLAIGGAVMVFGFGEGLVIPTLQERAASAGTAATRGTIVAVFVSASRLGQTAGPTAAAWIAAGPGGPRLTFLVAAAAAMTMGVLFALRPRRWSHRSG